MANIKSAKKRILVNEKKALRNKAAKSAVKTQVKKVDSAIAAGDKDAAEKALTELKGEMGRAAAKGIYKKNTNSRKISRMSKAVDKIGKEVKEEEQA
ncbi:MAG: 30S ribosomal protein S20 [Lachnospiraceae bacterium]|nr:30S ribosomal protein S20 [Lachnospiraceae bacterium]MCI1726431.1 30S ribosomal protein S20 [Lachnospiraceae bacterium]